MIHSPRSSHAPLILFVVSTVAGQLIAAQTSTSVPPPPKKAVPSRPAPARVPPAHAVPPTPPNGFHQLPRPNPQQPAPNRTSAPQPSRGETNSANAAQHPSASQDAAHSSSNSRQAVPAPQAAHPVPPVEARQRLNSWNAGRSSLGGLNSRPLPANAQLNQTANGRYVMSTPDGRNYALNSQGKIRAYLHGNVSAAIDNDGRLQAVRSPGMLVMRSPLGQRRVESASQNGTYVVSYGPNRGYVEHPVTLGGRSLIERTTITDGQVRVSHYQAYHYNGTVLENYVPQTYYSPSFYAWLGTPWSGPVTYSASFGSATVPAAYAPYYQPESSYISPSMFLTDEVISAQLATASANKTSAAPEESTAPSAYEDLPRVAAPTTTPITHEIKTQFAKQLTGVLASDQQAAQSASPIPAKEVPAALDPTIQFYFVDDGLDVKTARGDSHCSLSQGVALHRVDSVLPGAKEADLLVVSGLKGDCPAGTHVLVAISDLQSMNNHCHETLGPAVAKFAVDGGQHGLPATPPSGAHSIISSLGPDELAAKAKMASATITEQQAQSLRLEAETNTDMQASLH